MMDRPTFVRFAALFEVGLAVVAVVLGGLAGVRPSGIFAGPQSLAIGAAATLPLMGLYFIATRVPFPPLKRIHDILLSTLGRPLSECRWHELALLAALAGVCEELLFRGVLQPWIGGLGVVAGWVGANLLFGIAHAVTPTYFVLAMGIGFYLSAVQAAAGGDLVAAMLAHGLYDWFAFVQVAREFRRNPMGFAGSDDGGEAGDGDAIG